VALGNLPGLEDHLTKKSGAFRPHSSSSDQEFELPYNRFRLQLQEASMTHADIASTSQFYRYRQSNSGILNGPAYNKFRMDRSSSDWITRARSTISTSTLPAPDISHHLDR
jgi:hypothetical protein